MSLAEKEAFAMIQRAVSLEELDAIVAEYNEWPSVQLAAAERRRKLDAREVADDRL